MDSVVVYGREILPFAEEEILSFSYVLSPVFFFYLIVEVSDRSTFIQNPYYAPS